MLTTVPGWLVQNVASISAGNDVSVGEMIAEALDKVGSDGTLSIESSSSLETVVEVQEGMGIDRGYISPQFVTNQAGIQPASSWAGRCIPMPVFTRPVGGDFLKQKATCSLSTRQHRYCPQEGCCLKDAPLPPCIPVQTCTDAAYPSCHIQAVIQLFIPHIC